ncbi:MAG: aspartate aminotransferase family protein [Patescibacteria group bacterium]
MNLKRIDKKFLARESSDDIEIVKSEGSFLYDSKGKKYIDFLMGWCVGNIGWGNKEIKKVIKNFDGPTYLKPEFLYKPWAELAELLAKITPGKLQKSFRATGGTEAVEIALQVAMTYTKRSKFISIEGSYHGHSIGTMSIGYTEFRDKYSNLLPNCFKLSAPLDSKAADKLETLLKNRDIAALIMEPIICNLAVEIPQKEFMTHAQQLCKKYGTLLIMDEVASGFYRTGKLFATGHFNLEPDIMCMAKGLSSGYAPIGATIVTKEIADGIEKEFDFYSTYGWHPLSTVATIANIKYILKNSIKLEKNVNEMSEYFVNRLTNMKFKYTAEVRAQGLAIGVKFKDKNYASDLVKKAKKNGLLFNHINHGFIFFPALTIDQKTAKQGLDILEKVLR